jgi:hypothetical protein
LQTFALIAKLAVTLGLLLYLWLKVDAAAALVQFRNADLALLGAGTLVLGLLPLLGAARWRLVLASLDGAPRLGRLLRWTYVSVFFSQVLPATIGGDALRVWLAHRSGLGLKLAVNGVGLDRAAMVLTLLVLLSCVTPRLGALVDVQAMGYLMPSLLAAALLGLGTLMLADRLPARMQGLRAVRAVGYLAHDARRLFLRAPYAGGVAALCLLSYCLIIASVCLFALAFGASFAVAQLVVLLPAVLVASSLPISIGGWGTREIAMVAALATINIEASTALLTSLWLGIGSILIALPGAVLYLLDRAPLKPDTATLEARP